MNSVRAYNMNLNELIQSSNNRELVRDQSPLLNDASKPAQIDENLVSANQNDAGDSVKVDISPVWKEAAGKINLESATVDEVAVLSSSLFNANAITFEDHINLNFQKSSNDGEKIDFIEYWKTRQEDAIHHGAAHSELNDIVRIQSILSYVDSLRE